MRGFPVPERIGHAAHELVTPQNLASLGVAVGDEYTLRAAPTLGKIFGTATSALTRGATPASADIVWIPNGAAGSFDRYFLNPRGVWIDAADHSAVTAPIDMTSAIWIERKGGAANFKFTSPRSPSCSPPGKQESPASAE